MAIDDATLWQYINEVWNVYDVNHNGSLTPGELHLVMNDLYKRLGDNRNFHGA